MTRRAKFHFIGMEVGETATYKHEDFNVYCVTVPGGVWMERVA